MTSTVPAAEGADVIVARTIVVPLDGSRFAESAIPVARAIARRVDGRVLLMTTHWDDSDRAHRTAYLEGLAVQVDDVLTDVTSIDEHPAAPAIEHLVSDSPDRIVCMSSHGRGRFRWAVLGSVAEQVVSESRRPILLVGRHCRADWPKEVSHMLVCVDGSTVADPIVPVATRWATALGLDVHVAVVIHPLDFEGVSFPDEAVDAIVARFVAAGVEAAPVVLRGVHTAGAIADYASEVPVALIAMSTHARGGMARFALGSVAMGTVGLAECPLLLASTPEQ
jgi:nucleotide-binding universal stress UspA family protein